MSKYIFEMVLIVLFMIISYSGFTMNNLSEASKVASLSDKETREIQVAYSRDYESTIIDPQSSLLDSGTLAIKNPNKTSKNIGMVMQIKRSNDFNISDIEIFVDKKEIDMGVVLRLEDTYEIQLGAVSLDAYEGTSKHIEIFSELGSIPFEYSFKITGNF